MRARVRTFDVHRLSILLTPLLLAAGVLAPAAGSHTIERTRDAGVRLVWCYSSPDPAARSMTVAAWMATKRPNERLDLRVALQARKHGSAWLPVDAPDLGVWHSAPSKLDYHFRHKIQNLFDDARFRARVSYRWVRDGKIVQRTVRYSGECAQPDQRPSLRPSEPSFTALAGGGTGYRVLVTNRGRTPTGSFDVTVTGQGLEASAVFDRLEAGQARRLAVGGPACRPGTTVRIAVDARGAVEEANETDNAITVMCPP
jgi:hypothetical protein